MLNIALEVFVLSCLFGLSHGTECYLNDTVSGVIHYFGTRNITKSGIACQKWNEDFPHTINWLDETLPENYCRAVGVPNVIQCYTVNPDVQMEECDVAECGTECYLKDPASGSISYFGTKSVTKSGIACQKWNEDFPHTIHWPEEFFPENYCRPVGNVIQCYTVNPAVQMEECDVAECDGNNQWTTKAITETTDSFNTSVTSEGYTEQAPSTVGLTDSTTLTVESSKTTSTVKSHDTTVTTVKSSETTPTTVKLPETTPITTESSETTPTTVKSSEATPTTVESSKTTPTTVKSPETTPRTTGSSETIPTTVRSSETTPTTVKLPEATPRTTETSEATPACLLSECNSPLYPEQLKGSYFVDMAQGYNGYDIIAEDIMESIFQCALQCRRQDWCTSFQYNTQTSSCFLLRVGGGNLDSLNGLVFTLEY